MERFRKHRWSNIVALALLGAFFCGPKFGEIARQRGYFVNTTKSLPRGIYREQATVLRRGSLVAYCLEGALAKLSLERGYLGQGICSSGVMPLLKHVVATKGDVVRVNPQGVYVNGAIVPHSASKASDQFGRALPRTLGLHRVQEGSLWVLSTYAVNSWDSRYHGPIWAAQVIGSVEPVFLIES